MVPDVTPPAQEHGASRRDRPAASSDQHGGQCRLFLSLCLPGEIKIKSLNNSIKTFSLTSDQHGGQCTPVFIGLPGEIKIKVIE